MPIRGSPNGARHPRPQAGRDRPEWVVAINWNAWSRSIGTAGRDHPVRALSPSKKPSPAIRPRCVCHDPRSRLLSIVHSLRARYL